MPPLGAPTGGRGLVVAAGPGISDAFTDALAGADGGWMEKIGGVLGGDGKRQGAAEAFTKSLTRTVATSIGRAIVNSIFGGRR